MKRLILFTLLAGGGILAWQYQKLGAALDYRELYALLDRFAFSVPAVRSSKLMAELDKRAGSCVVEENSAAVTVGGEWITVKGTVLPFGQPVRVAPIQQSLVPSGLGFVACHDGNGGGFLLKKQVWGMVLQLDREPGGPIRIKLLSRNEVRLVGKKIWVLLRSPVGDLEVRSLADTEISVELVADSSENLFRQVITVLSGQVHLERRAPVSIEGSAGRIDLRAQKGGRLQWGNQQEAVVEERSATVLPSGFYWNSP